MVHGGGRQLKLGRFHGFERALVECERSFVFFVGMGEKLVLLGSIASQNDHRRGRRRGSGVPSNMGDRNSGGKEGDEGEGAVKDGEGGGGRKCAKVGAHKEVVREEMQE